ncbi:hypothetical protein ACIBI9_06315 [Nonomuraea sp. NPDC050451]|uniref:hypothetical protein n=1 Tax=Nonomuraea sp. NPDC050451 TaxID=3364364 RepID=UPI00378FCF46
MSVPIAIEDSRAEAKLITGLLRTNGLAALVSPNAVSRLEPQLQLQGVRVPAARSQEAAAPELLADRAGAS